MLLRCGRLSSLDDDAMVDCSTTNCSCLALLQLFKVSEQQLRGRVTNKKQFG